MAEKTYLHADFRALRDARDAGESLAKPWKAFCETVRQNIDTPPYIAKDTVAQLQRVQGHRNPEEVVILDHGFGNGFLCLYLLALGYTGVYGVNVGDRKESWGSLLKEVYGNAEPRFMTYDARRLPLPDESVDFVFSNQVIEHVRDEVWDAYFEEEFRVLKPGGVAFHEIPHRLSPYDSHTRSWFVHYLPRATHGPTYRLLGRGHYNHAATILRMPHNIRRQIESKIGPVENLTGSSFIAAHSLESFDGSMRLRTLIHRACTLPAIGPVNLAILSKFVMLRVRATKPVSSRPV